MITGNDNQAVKHIVRLRERSRYRKTQKEFVVEGLKMVREIPRDLLREVYVSASFCESEHNQEFLGTLPSYQVMSEQVFLKASGTKSPQGILAVAAQKAYDPAIFSSSENALIVMLEGIQDPGNLGTIFRTAEAAGVSGIVMSEDTADIYNPKVVRSTMGSIFRVPFVYEHCLAEKLVLLRDQGFTAYAAHLAGAVVYTEIAYSKRAVLLIGNEGGGLSAQITDLCDTRVRLPMRGQVESLNAAVAASILMYEIESQRR